ncbi:hypothetical protein [Cellulomonas soli]
MPVLSPPLRTGPMSEAARGPGAGHRLPAARRLARWSATHRWTAVLLWLLLVVVTVGAGGAVGMRTLTGAESGAGSPDAPTCCSRTPGSPPTPPSTC